MPVLYATSAKSSLGGCSSKRSHSAASNQDSLANDETTVQIPDTPTRSGGRGGYYRGLTASPEKMARRGQILNKIETIRILRARPAFYPMKNPKDVSSTTSMAMASDPFDLPSNILGKHITLRMDRGEMKKKKRILPPTSSHLT